MSDKFLTGTVAEDPAKSLDIGGAIKFIAPPMRLNPPENAVKIDNWEIFNGALLSVNFIDNTEHRVCGSAVMVAPGVALSATHVIEPWIPDLMEGKLSPACFGVSSHGLEIWRLKKLTIVPGTDITIFCLEYASDFPPENLFHLTRITTRLPKLGEKLTVCGFRASETVFEVIDGNKSTTEGNLWICQGEVKERYCQGRDQSMLPWPVLEIDCPSHGGMSGGPVFDQNGLLVGILCSSLEHENGEGTSYISLLWHALAARIEPVWPEGLIKGPISLLEIEQLCAIDKREAIEVAYDEENSRRHTAYKIWE